MRYFLKKTTIAALFLLLAFFLTTPILAQDCASISCSKDASTEEYLACNKNKQACWEGKIQEAQTAKITLNNTISILNGQISVQELQIDQTQTEITFLENQITELTDRISGLDVSLDKLSQILVERVGEQYKRLHTNPLLVLITRRELNTALSEYKYLQLAKEQTADAMSRAEVQRNNYDEQKTLKEQTQTALEQKRTQLQGQQNQLTTQRSEQQFLLTETRNNEARYQSELAKTLGELEAIQSIIAGKGSETAAGSVAEGETIASVIIGASACSTGTHLHFEVVKDGVHRDPAGYLKSISAIWNNSPDGSFGFSGGWDWPLNDPAKINQGYGMTYYARVRRAYGGAPHTGIDMFSKNGSSAVKAVKAGNLYRGSIKCGGGLLRYVRVQHNDDGVSTYYLHVNY